MNIICFLLDGEDSAVCKQARLDLPFEEWDGAGLPWWFLGNLRSNYDPRSHGSTDIPSNQVTYTSCSHLCDIVEVEFQPKLKNLTFVYLTNIVYLCIRRYLNC